MGSPVEDRRFTTLPAYNHHRVWTAEAVARHTLFRQETRWPGYYYRADHPKLNDADWQVFTASQYDAKTGDWRMSKLPVHHIIS